MLWKEQPKRASMGEVNGSSCHFMNTFSRIWNKRTDEYGPQSLENRARFMCDVIRTAKKRIGGDFTVTCLYNVAEYNHPLATTFEEGVGFAKYLEAAGVDAIQVRPMITPIVTVCSILINLASGTASQSTQRPGLEPAWKRGLGAPGHRR
jgi:hypothetical protein